MTTVFILLAIGLLLLLFEVVLPSGIAGLLGVGLIIAASVVCYQDYGLPMALLTFLVAGATALVIFIGGMKFLPKSRLGRHFFHHDTQRNISVSAVGKSSLIGKKGVAHSTLAPTGVVFIDGCSYEAQAIDGLIEQGTPVEVIDQKTFALIVVAR